jgi:hypothetical protein
VDLSVLPFLGLLALGFPTLNADLRQLCAANSAVSERLEYRNSGIVAELLASVTPYLTSRAVELNPPDGLKPRKSNKTGGSYRFLLRAGSPYLSGP